MQVVYPTDRQLKRYAPDVLADLGVGDEPRFRVIPRRWVVERTLAWLNRFRRLTVCYERRADLHQAFLSLGCALICWQALQR